MPKVLFLTTHNLSSNPRLVKEMRLLLQHGYEVEVVCYIFRNWSFNMNENLLEEFRREGVRFHCIEAGKENILSWASSIGKEKANRFLSTFFFIKGTSLANAVSRRNAGLMRAIKKVCQVDWVIGHNPGALWATLIAGKGLKAKMGFDIEDYHPGEGYDMHLQRLTKNMMQQVLPKMDYVSFAAPLIMDAVKKDINSSDAKWFTILNYFPANEFSLATAPLTGRVKMVWFSQNIDKGRGLELILPFVKTNIGKIEMHLFGNVNADFKKEHLRGENIYLHGPLTQKELHQSLAQFDIGFALETAKDRNNDLAISNKLLAYMQAGLYVVATNTTGQYSVLKNFQDMGICFDYKENDSQEILEMIINNIDIIRSNRTQRYESFKGHNWESESKKILAVFNQPKQH